MTPRRRKQHKPERIVAKLRDADVMQNAGKELAAVQQALEISEATVARWLAQPGLSRTDPASAGGAAP